MLDEAVLVLRRTAFTPGSFRAFVWEPGAFSPLVQFVSIRTNTAIALETNGPMAIELWSGSPAVRKRSDPTVRQPDLYSNASRACGLRYVKSAFVLLMALNVDGGLTWTKDEVKKKCLTEI